MEYPKMIYKGGIASTGVVVNSKDEEASYEGFSPELGTYDEEPAGEVVEEKSAPRRGRPPKAE